MQRGNKIGGESLTASRERPPSPCIFTVSEALYLVSARVPFASLPSSPVYHPHSDTHRTTGRVSSSLLDLLCTHDALALSLLFASEVSAAENKGSIDVSLYRKNQREGEARESTIQTTSRDCAQCDLATPSSQAE